MLAGLLVLLLALGAAAWRLARRLRTAERRLRELELLRHEVAEAREGAARELRVTRRHLAAVAAGSPPAGEAILQGTPYEDVAPGDGLALYERSPALFVLDVRTPAEYAEGHIPGARLIPLDQLEERLAELPGHDAPILVTCAAGGRSVAACQLLGERGWTRLHNLVGGMHAWPGPRVREEPGGERAAAAAPETAVSYRGGPISGEQVVAALRECYDPEIPLNVYDLGLVYGIEVAPSAIAVRMTLTSQDCPSARAIPEEVRRRVAALGQPNVSVDVVFDPPWHPSRISHEGKQKLGLA